MFHPTHFGQGDNNSEVVRQKRIDREYRLGIRLARNNYIIRNSQDYRLKAVVARDSQAIRNEIGSL